MYMVVAFKGGSGWAKRTKAGEDDEALAAAKNAADRKESEGVERLMTGG